MTQSERSITIEGELVYHWWRDEGDQVSINGQPLDDVIAVLPVLNKSDRKFAISPRATPYVVEERTSYGQVRLTIEALP